MGAVSDNIQRYMAEYPENCWEQLKSELNVRFAKANDPHHAFTMLHKPRLNALAKNAFAKVDKAVVESQLVGFFTDELYHDFLQIKVMRENPKGFQTAVQSGLAEQNLQKRFQFRSNDHTTKKVELRNQWK